MSMFWNKSEARVFFLFLLWPQARYLVRLIRVQLLYRLICTIKRSFGFSIPSMASHYYRPLKVELILLLLASIFLQLTSAIYILKSFSWFRLFNSSQRNRLPELDHISNAARIRIWFSVLNSQLSNTITSGWARRFKESIGSNKNAVMFGSKSNKWEIIIFFCIFKLTPTRKKLKLFEATATFFWSHLIRFLSSIYVSG